MQRTLPAHPHDAPGFDDPEPKRLFLTSVRYETPAENWMLGLCMRRIAEYGRSTMYFSARGHWLFTAYLGSPPT